jgi:hypothetical protein
MIAATPPPIVAAVISGMDYHPEIFKTQQKSASKAQKEQMKMLKAQAKANKLLGAVGEDVDFNTRPFQWTGDYRKDLEGLNKWSADLARWMGDNETKGELGIIDEIRKTNELLEGGIIPPVSVDRLSVSAGNVASGGAGETITDQGIRKTGRKRRVKSGMGNDPANILRDAAAQIGELGQTLGKAADAIDDQREDPEVQANAPSGGFSLN